MKRRTFLQLTGMSAMANLLAGCRQGNEKLIPFLVSPDDGIAPGEANFYASACRSCPAGCGILVRVTEGRAKKVEGNPHHPVNRGKLCARGQALVQELYHPDRVRQPLKRTGERGSGEFTAISWEEAIGLVREKLTGLQSAGRQNRLAVIAPPLRGTLDELLSRFLETFGAAPYRAWELFGPEWREAGDFWGRGSIPPAYDLARTQYLMSFGADFLETDPSPVQYGEAFGAMRQARPTVRGRFSYVGPRLSMTAASADRWLPVKPGSEGVLALGLARHLLAHGAYQPGSLAAAGIGEPEVRALVQDYSLARVARETGVAQPEIAAAAQELATIRPALVMAGAGVSAHSNGPATTAAVELLNVLLGNRNLPGGLFDAAPAHSGPVARYPAMKKLIAGMNAGEVDMLWVYGSNPAYTAPAAAGFAPALAQVPFVVSFASVIDDTAARADLILPDHATLESWGDVIPPGGVLAPVTGLMQPVVEPLYDTRPFGDVLLALGQALGGPSAQALPEGSYREVLRKRIAGILALEDGESFERAWNKVLQQGVLVQEPPPATGNRQPRRRPQLVAPRAARFAGGADEKALHLLVYPSPVFATGEGSHLPWLQQLPDPMTTAVWGSWVEINPQTAARLDIAHGDLVEVSSEQGKIQVPAVVYPGIHPQMVAIPLGQGHTGFERYGRNRGANPLDLLVAVPNDEGIRPAWGATKVELRVVSRRSDLVTAGHPAGSYRGELLEI